MHGIVELARGRAGGGADSASIGSDHPVRLFTRRRKTKSIMPVMSQILRRLGRWGALLALCSLANRASGMEKDWLDEMPSVPAVVQAVREQVEVYHQRNPALVGDEDYLAEMIVGNFTLLRWVMDVQSAKEWHMSDRRRERMRKIAMDYMQVELAIGLGVGKRKGHIKDNCDQKDAYLNRLGQKMYTTTECYRLRFHLSVDMTFASHAERTEMFPRLFCDRSQYYVDLVRERILKAPSPNLKPAETLSLPDDVRPLGPAVCEHYDYDSDGNKNGLCDDWEKPLPKTAQATAAGRPGCAARCSKPNYTCETADEAAQFALEMAWHKTRSFGDNTEWGGLIYELVPNDFRYTAPEVGVAAKPGDVAKVEGSVLSHVWRTLKRKALLDGKEIKLIANYHTHPRNGNPTYLSINDINGAIPVPNPDPEKNDPGYGTIYMRGANGETCGIHMYIYNPKAEPKHVRVEPLEEKAAKQPAAFWGKVGEKLYKIGVTAGGEKWDYETAGERQEREDSRRSATTWIPLAEGHQRCPCDLLGECPLDEWLTEWNQDWGMWPQAQGKASRALEVVKGWGNQGLDMVKGGASRAWEAVGNLFAR